MTTYIIREKQNLNSQREGERVTAKNLTAAKRKAAAMQCFHGTTLCIEAENGALLASKKDGAKWVNY